MTGTHENGSRQEALKPSSDRTFGLVVTAFFFAVAFLPLLRGHRMRGWAVVLGGGFLLAALASPTLLAPLNRFWTALGSALHRITNPIILGVFFYLVFTPLGWFLRLTGKDFLRLKRSPSVASYWIPRDPPGPEPESIANQF